MGICEFNYPSDRIHFSFKCLCFHSLIKTGKSGKIKLEHVLQIDNVKNKNSSSVV